MASPSYRDATIAPDPYPQPVILFKWLLGQHTGNETYRPYYHDKFLYA
jgi:hypothetical protein